MNLPSHKPWIIAHRGASHAAPENTLAAFELAWREDADGIEGDFRLTRDGRIICMHDETTEKTAGQNLCVADATLDELRRLDVGAWKAPTWAGERVPTLDEVLTIIPPGKRIFIEIKCGAQVIAPLERVLARSQVKPEQIALIAYDQDVVSLSKKSIPQIKSHWITAYEHDPQTGRMVPTLDEVLETLQRIGAHGLSSEANLAAIDAGFAAAVLAAGFELHTWTVNDPDTARRFQSLGFRSLTTDRPGDLRESLWPEAAGQAS